MPRARALFAGAAAAAACTLTLAAMLGLRADDVPGVVTLPPNPQRLGDPAAGREYLLYGDYIGSGIPLRMWHLLQRQMPLGEPLIEREGINATLPHSMNAFEMPDGTEVAAAVNCLGCHAQVFNGELVIGMGNTLADWTGGGTIPLDRVRLLGEIMLPSGSPEKAAFDQFMRGVDALDGRADAPFRGVNPAFRLEEVAASHRNPPDFAWREEPVYDAGETVIASDVPPWWNVRKKQALYYTGVGRGDFAALIEQINIVGVGTAEDAARHHARMPDVLAYLATLEPPAYPAPIDPDLAARGAEVFAAECASCHGTYDSSVPGLGVRTETYPSKLVHVDKVGTDPLYAEIQFESGLYDWFRESWYAGTEPPSIAEPSLAYIAPPLDGIWCTAPYLHNGSVPTLEALLDSSKRPDYWRRTFRDDDYDLERVGWSYRRLDGPVDKNTYDTTLPGYGNGGHTYADHLGEADRRALLEYLKSL